MTRYFPFFVLLFFSSNFCQAQLCNMAIGNVKGTNIDSNSFDSATSIVECLIDSSNINNSWQIGTISKPGFGAAHSGARAIQTDSVNSYHSNDSSEFVIYLNQNALPSHQSFSFSFWHKYDTDSGHAKCILLFTDDFGATWQDVNDTTSHYGVLQYNGSKTLPLGLKPMQWTGSNNAWQQELFCFTFFAIKIGAIASQRGFKFLFVTDSSASSKAGWAIDDIQVAMPNLSVSSIDDKQKKISIAPNPVSNHVVQIEMNASNQGLFSLYNMAGHKILEAPLQASMVLPSNLQGLFFYKIYNKQHQLLATDKMLILP